MGRNTQLTTDLRELGKQQVPSSVAADEIDTRPVVLVHLSDAHEQEVVSEVLRQGGIRVSTDPNSVRPAVVVADTGTVLNVMAGIGVRLVLMNASGPDALAGKFARLRPEAYVRRRAPAVDVLQAVNRILTERSGE